MLYIIYAEWCSHFPFIYSGKLGNSVGGFSWGGIVQNIINYKLYRLFSNLLFNKRWIQISFSFAIYSSVDNYMSQCLFSFFIFPYLHWYSLQVFVRCHSYESFHSSSFLHSQNPIFYLILYIFIFVQKRRRTVVHLLHHLFNYNHLFKLYQW